MSKQSTLLFRFKAGKVHFFRDNERLPNGTMRPRAYCGATIDTGNGHKYLGSFAGSHKHLVHQLERVCKNCRKAHNPE